MPLTRGDRVPDFVLPSAAGVSTRFFGVAGGTPAVLLAGIGVEVANAVASTLGEEADVLLVATEPPAARAEGVQASVFVDADGAVRAKLLRVEPGTTAAFLLDPGLRVATVLEAAATDATALAAAARAALAALPRVEPIDVVAQAPVSLVPDVLDAEICGFLTGLLDAKGGVESGVEALAGGEYADVIRHDAKRRKDHVVEDPELLRLLTATIGRRLFPEIQRAFQYRATRFEGFKIARYDETGFFRPHRDNLSPATAHRRFSVTLNLNAGYDGGHLRFPEYGPHRYRPAPGGAVIFSASLLHEVLPVTKGTRYVLITFVWGEDVKRA